MAFSIDKNFSGLQVLKAFDMGGISVSIGDIVQNRIFDLRRCMAIYDGCLKNMKTIVLYPEGHFLFQIICFAKKLNAHLDVVQHDSP